MSEGFHKFPHTPHLMWLGRGSPRDDKVVKSAEQAAFLASELIVEEKVDGANLGISIGPGGRLRAQSRGNFLAPGRSHAQWNLLWPWLAEHRSVLEEGLPDGLLLFGEWCYSRHTVPYDALPDWFLGFDLLEIGTGRFWSADRRNQWLQVRGLTPVPEVSRGRFQANQIPALLGHSKVGNVPMEGIYLRRESDGYLQARAKVVSSAFKQQIEEHWTRRPVVPNRLAQVQA
jgi:hypothetical protein